jgi:hypothetical protein
VAKHSLHPLDTQSSETLTSSSQHTERRNTHFILSTHRLAKHSLHPLNTQSGETLTSSSQFTEWYNTQFILSIQSGETLTSLSQHRVTQHSLQINRGYAQSVHKLMHSHQVHTVGSRFATVRFMTIQFYDPCRVGPSTPDLWCITVATQASFLYLVPF